MQPYTFQQNSFTATAPINSHPIKLPAVVAGGGSSNADSVADESPADSRTDDRQDRADGCQRHLRLLQKKRQQCYQRQPRDRLGSCASLSGHGEAEYAPRIKGNYKQYEVFSYDKIYW